MDIPWFPWYIALYPEIHYTFGLFFSRLRHSQPEIVVDCPHRIEPGKTIPLLCLIKHANRFPVHLHSIKVQLHYDQEEREEIQLWNTSSRIQDYLWYRTFHLEPKQGYSGDIVITTELQIQKGKRPFHIFNHNYRGGGQSPLRVHIAKTSLPRLDNWYDGESHCHSFHSDDQVEFGAPVQPTVDMAEALGLKWLAVTDHSYDLDDTYGNSLQRDDMLLKWNRLKSEIEEVNTTGKCFVLLGEEVSCGNARNKNVHLLAFGIKNLIPGSGDGAERWFRTKPEYPIKEVLRRVKLDGGIAYAAHPEERFTLGERFMLRRGHWETTNYDLPDFSGLQFWNGKKDKAFQAGYERWVEMLLKGRRIFFIGGDDSHGDFNTFRQIRIPLLRMINSPHKVFGKVRTSLYCEGKLDEKGILAALREGHIVVTSGPFVTCWAKNETGQRVTIGDTISGKTITLDIVAKSTEEFGDIECITLIEGHVHERRERRQRLTPGLTIHERKEIVIKGISIHIKNPLYIRLEATSRGAKESYYAYTNPIWLNPI